MTYVERIGAYTLLQLEQVRYFGNVIGAVILLACQPRFWPRTVRNILARQILFTGIEAAGFILLLAALVGISLIQQAHVWLGALGRDVMVALVSGVLINQIGPILVNFVIIGRSGTAITTELANMRVRGEVDVLDAQGFDPLAYLVLPRVVGMMVSTFCLSVLFIVGALVIGYLAGFVTGTSTMPPDMFVASVLSGVTLLDFVGLAAKTMIPSLVTGTLCCVYGLGVGRSITEIPQAVTRAVVASIVMLFVVITILTVVLGIYENV